MKVAIRVRQRTLQDCIVLDDAVAEDLAVANAAVTAAVDIVFAGRKGDRKMFFGSFTINLFDPQILFNDGFYDLVDVRIPAGTLLKPQYPAALSGRTHALGRIFDQDGANLPQVQRGMKASKTGEAVLANYQEIRIRHFHQTIDKYLDA